MPVIEIIILAKSKKLGGKCIAGLRTDGGGWLRPVAPSHDGTLFSSHYTLMNGTEAEVLDVVRIELKEPRPEIYQPENWVIGDKKWRLITRPRLPEYLEIIRPHVVSGPDLLGNQSDRISINSFKKAPAKESLAIVIPKKIDWIITKDIKGKRQVRGAFKLENVEYNLAVTDLRWNDRFKYLKEDIYSLESLKSIGLKPSDEFLLIISLGEPFTRDNATFHFKLIASVIHYREPISGRS